MPPLNPPLPFIKKNLLLRTICNNQITCAQIDDLKKINVNFKVFDGDKSNYQMLYISKAS